MYFFRAVGSLLLAAMPFLVHATPPQKVPSEASRAGKLIFLEQDEEMRLALGAAPDLGLVLATFFDLGLVGVAVGARPLAGLELAGTSSIIA